MKPASFEYHRATSVADALAALGQADGMGRLLAGGQSLVPMLNLRLTPVGVLIDIKRIAELSAVQDDGQTTRYGACVTHAAFEDGSVPDAVGGFLRHVAAGIAYRAVRNRGTLGGALALADASTDWVTAMLGAGAAAVIQGAGATRRVPMAQFIHGPYVTALRPDEEILAAIEVPHLSSRGRWGYYKIMQKPGEYASSLASAVCDPERNTARVVLGGANRAPILLGRTARLFAAHGTWTESLAVQLEDEIRADLSEAGRDGEPGELRAWITTAQRAIQRACKS